MSSWSPLIFIQWPIDPKQACPRGTRAELWLNEEEFHYISGCLKETGFQVERIEETPRKPTSVSVSQLSIRSGSNRSLGRSKSVVTSNRISSINISAQSGRDTLPEPERNEYRRLVQLIIRTHKIASQPFLFPVPDTVVGYYDVIKKPVDLTTIRQRLDSSSYRNRGDFEQDFLQMLWNAYVFNPPHSDVFRSALELHSAFVIGLQKSVIALNDQKRSEAFAHIEAARKKRQQAARRSTSDLQSRPRSSTAFSGKKPTTEEELRKKLEFLQKVVTKQTSSGAGPRKVSQADVVKPLTDRQLDQLADELEQLDPKYVPQIAHVLKGEQSATVADGQLDLSIHDLTPAKQRELLRLMEKIRAQEALRERMNERVRDYDSESEDADYASKRMRT
jgi:hypothetical protein